ncbi:unnamed protein product [Amoebophrya sp. A120]|nr:unnamed protein product [Amoebophrya sp. A120]|eukprot:GSA120T00006165001.1
MKMRPGFLAGTGKNGLLSVAPDQPADSSSSSQGLKPSKIKNGISAVPRPTRRIWDETLVLDFQRVLLKLLSEKGLQLELQKRLRYGTGAKEMPTHSSCQAEASNYDKLCDTEKVNCDFCASCSAFDFDPEEILVCRDVVDDEEEEDGDVRISAAGGGAPASSGSRTTVLSASTLSTPSTGRTTNGSEDADLPGRGTTPTSTSSSGPSKNRISFLPSDRRGRVFSSTTAVRNTSKANPILRFRGLETPGLSETDEPARLLKENTTGAALFEMLPAIVEKTASTFANVLKKAHAPGPNRMPALDADTAKQIRKDILKETVLREILSRVFTAHNEQQKAFAQDAGLLATPNGYHGDWNPDLNALTAETIQELMTKGYAFQDDFLPRSEPRNRDTTNSASLSSGRTRSGPGAAQSAFKSSASGQSEYVKNLWKIDCEKVFKELETLDFEVGMFQAVIQQQQVGLRSDRICFSSLDSLNRMRHPMLRKLYQCLISLPFELNKKCNLLLQGTGTFQLGVYHANGAFYKKHLDGGYRERDNGRKITCIFYPNDNDVSALRVHDPKTGETKDILPKAGRLVLLQARDVPHEVLPNVSKKKRFAVSMYLNGPAQN